MEPFLGEMTQGPSPIPSAVVFFKTPMWGFWQFFSTGTYTRLGTGEFEIKMTYAKKKYDQAIL